MNESTRLQSDRGVFEIVGSEVEIQIGDFIKATSNGLCCGLVVAIGSVLYGGQRLTAYKVRLGNGRLDVVLAYEAIFIAR